MIEKSPEWVDRTLLRRTKDSLSSALDVKVNIGFRMSPRMSEKVCL